jgi:hypothetical protein
MLKEDSLLHDARSNFVILVIFEENGPAVVSVALSDTVCAMQLLFVFMGTSDEYVR